MRISITCRGVKVEIKCTEYLINCLTFLSHSSSFWYRNVIIPNRLLLSGFSA